MHEGKRNQTSSKANVDHAGHATHVARRELDGPRSKVADLDAVELTGPAMKFDGHSQVDDRCFERIRRK